MSAGNHIDHSWISAAPGSLMRIEAFFPGKAYGPHRHDTYTIALTVTGVQCFNYRGAARHSLPGRVVVLHPDETHDGQAGTGEGFRYRAIYVAPAALQPILGGRTLPYIRGGVSSRPELIRAARALLMDLTRPFNPLELEDGLYDLARALETAAGGRVPSAPASFRTAATVREVVHDRLEDGLTLADLEAASGQNRWQLSRDFRRFFGTSPYRYLTLRRLDRARDLMTQGQSLAVVAQASGFADQSHFTRCFKQAFGITPKRWVCLLARV